MQVQYIITAYCMQVQYIIATGVTEGGQRGELSPWQSKI